MQCVWHKLQMLMRLGSHQKSTQGAMGVSTTQSPKDILDEAAKMEVAQEDDGYVVTNPEMAASFATSDNEMERSTGMRSLGYINQMSLMHPDFRSLTGRPTVRALIAAAKSRNRFNNAIIALRGMDRGMLYEQRDFTDRGFLNAFRAVATLDIAACQRPKDDLDVAENALNIQGLADGLKEINRQWDKGIISPREKGIIMDVVRHLPPLKVQYPKSVDMRAASDMDAASDSYTRQLYVLAKKIEAADGAGNQVSKQIMGLAAAPYRARV